MQKEFTDINITKFKGLYNRGVSDSVPKDYFTDCLNVMMDASSVFTRPGSDLVFTKALIRRTFRYKRLGETPRDLILLTNGEFYDSLHPATPLLTDTDHLDFSAVNFFNRAYITFHNRIVGITGTFLYVYEGGGPGTLRLAAGSPPVGFTLSAANSATSGDVEEGTHLFALVFETSSGFLTAPGPEDFAVLVADGGKKVDISNAIAGPSGTVARRIIATRSTTDYDGNQFGLEFFFVPNGRIPDNSATTITVNFFDGDLVDSADYLFDNRSTIPGGLGVTTYDNRLVLWGVPGDEHVIFVSNPLEPEVFSSIDGYIICDPSDSIAGVRNCHEHRNQLFIHKPNRTYAIVTNGEAPSTWGSPHTIDRGAGTEIFGVSTILDAKGSNTDRFFIADASGLLCFEAAVFKRPEVSWNIKGIWDRINKVHFNKVVVSHDTESQHILIGVPLDAATEISHVLFADYSNSFSPIGFIIPQNVKWTIWQFPSTLSHMFVDINTLDNTAYFNYCLTAGNIYRQGNFDDDDGSAIESFWETYSLFVGLNKINHFGKIFADVTGSGTITIRLANDKATVTTSYTNTWSVTSSNNPKKRLINFKSEMMRVKFHMTALNERFSFSHVTVKAKEWGERPHE